MKVPLSFRLLVLQRLPGFRCAAARRVPMHKEASQIPAAALCATCSALVAPPTTTGDSLELVI